MALDPDNLKRAKLAIAAKARELDQLIRRRESAAQAEPPPVQYVITPVNFMDLPPEVRARYERASWGSPHVRQAATRTASPVRP